MLEVWRERERHLEEIKPILQQKLATLEEQKKRLVDAFVYKQAIDEETYKNELDRLRAEITVTRIERNDSELDALDVETVLEFAEHVVLNARRMWSEFPLKHRRRMQKVLFPEGLAYDGEAFRTPVTCLFLRDSAGAETGRFKTVQIRFGKGGRAYGIRTRAVRVRFPRWVLTHRPRTAGPIGREAFSTPNPFLASAGSPWLVESKSMKNTARGLLRRGKQLERYSRLEKGLPASPVHPAKSIAGIGWLYELLPRASRNRPVDPSGVVELHRCLAVLHSGSGS